MYNDDVEHFKTSSAKTKLILAIVFIVLGALGVLVARIFLGGNVALTVGIISIVPIIVGGVLLSFALTK
jgi:hypothetical protein